MCGLETDRPIKSQTEPPEIEDGQEDGTSGTSEDDYSTDGEDGQWYLGRARDEFNRRKKGQAPGKDVRAGAGAVGADDDPVQVCSFNLLWTVRSC